MDQPLSHMKQLNQWINWKMVNGAKLPTDPTGGKIDAHNPVHWLPFDQCTAPAFVLTENDPFFCVDLDNCMLPDGSLTPGAQSIVNLFNGALVEISQSGKGMHIWGCGSLPENHAKKFDYNGQKVECYTRKRFIIIGTPCGGTEWLDCSATLTEFVPLREDSKPEDWTDAPCAEWAGPSDDDELIRRMLAAKSSADATFGNKATFRQLWEADATALSAAFPDAGNRSYDASSADAALMQHLAFWTGKDCARMDRLFRRSALMRDKWEKRQDYRTMTATGAVHRCQRVYNRPQPQVSEDASNKVAQVRTGGHIMDAQEQLELFKGCCYVTDVHRVLTPKGALLKSEQFNALYGGYQFVMDTENAKLTDKAFDCLTNSRMIKFPKADGSCFKPDLESGSIIDYEGRTLVNTYVPATIDRRPGDITPFMDLMNKLFPNEGDRAQVLAYMAACVQHPGIKFQWCPVIQGMKGNGKTAIATCIQRSIGRVYSHVFDPALITSDFNGWIERKLFITIEEIFIGDNQDASDKIKTWITNPDINIHRKGAEQGMTENCANFIAMTNHKDAVKIDNEERRYAVYYTAQQCMDDLRRDGMTGDYFPRLYEWLRGGGFAHVAEYLHTCEIPAHLNPATVMMRAPVTSSREEVLQNSLTRSESEIKEQVDADAKGFRGDWISSEALTEFLKEKRLNLSSRKFREHLERLGYIPHPYLPKGRATTVIFEENTKRPVLYVRKGSISEQMDNPQRIIEAYRKAQGYSLVQVAGVA